MNIYIKDSEEKAVACVIWMHGLGADANDMAGLVDQLSIVDIPLRHVFMNAPIRPVTLNNGLEMRAWYDIVDLKFDREDEAGVLQSEQLIRQVIDNQINEGFSSLQIFLAGFSQGAAMALYTALHYSEPLGGVICLSGYLPLALKCKPVQPKNLPIFMAGGQYDPIVLPIWTSQSVKWLKDAGYHAVPLHTYLMEHTVCMDEVQDVSIWLTNRIEEALAK